MTEPTTSAPAAPFASEAWTDRYRRSLMDTFGAPRLVLARGEGAHVWDVDGREYLDLLGGIASTSLGHQHPALVSAVTQQLGTLGHVSNFFATEPQVRLAEELLTLVGASGTDDAEQLDGRVFFTNSGTEANEAAVKLLRLTGRSKVVAAVGAFHGRTLGALAVTWKPAYREPFAPLPGDVVFVPYGDESALAAAVDEDTAGVILEPIQGEAGVIVPPSGYLHAARRLTSAHGALLVLDEVQSGMGRTGQWFAHRGSGVRPDVVTVAKGLGGGIPVGACIALGAAASLLGPGSHGTTFGGNPIAAAAALAVIDTIRSEGLLHNVRDRSDQLRRGILALEHPLVAGVRGEGLLLAVALTQTVAAELTQELQRRGVIVNNVQPDALRLAPPLTVTAADIAEFLAVLPGALDAVLPETQQRSSASVPAGVVS
ncbi:MAG: acetylornithine transaminase [Actinomycetales bacterium]